MALLKLADKYSLIDLEGACKHTLLLTDRPSLKSVQAILRSGRDMEVKEDAMTEITDCSSQYAFTRGPDYYRGGED